MGRCRATKRFRRKGSSKKFMSGAVRCSKQIASHVLRPRQHGGYFNGESVTWDITPEERIEYLAQHDEVIEEMRVQRAEWAAIQIMEKPQGVS